METLTLVENIRHGREVRSCQEELYSRVYEYVLPRLTRTLPARLRSRLDPEDLLHDAFVRAMKALDLFEPSSEKAFYAWILTIARNLLIDQSRRRSVFAEHFRKGDESPRGPRESQIPDPGRRPESEVARQDDVDTLLKRLKEKEAEVIRLRRLQGLSFEEIAEAWGKNPGAIQRFYARAIEKLRQLAEADSRES